MKESRRTTLGRQIAVTFWLTVLAAFVAVASGPPGMGSLAFVAGAVCGFLVSPFALLFISNKAPRMSVPILVGMVSIAMATALDAAQSVFVVFLACAATVVVTSAALGYALPHVRTLRRDPGRCRECGSDVSGIAAERCPECGIEAPIDGGLRRSYEWPRWLRHRTYRRCAATLAPIAVAIVTAPRWLGWL